MESVNQTHLPYAIVVAAVLFFCDGADSKDVSKLIRGPNLGTILVLYGNYV